MKKTTLYALEKLNYTKNSTLYDIKTSDLGKTIVLRFNSNPGGYLKVH
jgi:hypothetical protein